MKLRSRNAFIVVQWFALGFKFGTPPLSKSSNLNMVIFIEEFAVTPCNNNL